VSLLPRAVRSQVIDLLVRMLQFPLQGAVDLVHLVRVFKGAYDVLYTYMIGNSRKNALYFAKYIDFFQTQITVKVVRYLLVVFVTFTMVDVVLFSFTCIHRIHRVHKK